MSVAFTTKKQAKNILNHFLRHTNRFRVHFPSDLCNLVVKYAVSKGSILNIFDPKQITIKMLKNDVQAIRKGPNGVIRNQFVGFSQHISCDIKFEVVKRPRIFTALKNKNFHPKNEKLNSKN